MCKHQKLTNMKSVLLLLGIGLITTLVACDKDDSEYSPNCNTPKTFSGDASPVIRNSCATTGCHDNGSNNGPGPLTTYQQVFNARSGIRSSVATGRMPQGSSLSDAQKDAILCWIDGGAPNN
jgi:hypothetical protein